MKITKILMGMPITVEIVDTQVTTKDIDDVFDYFTYVDTTFSTYKKTSEISLINEKKIKEKNYSKDMQEVLFLSKQTNYDTKGFFDIKKNGLLDPSGLVKGWAIYNAYKIVKMKGFKNFYIDAGGDIQVSGKNNNGKKWIIGIRSPMNIKENVKIIQIENQGVATSGTYIRGQHVYDPHKPSKKLSEIVSFTVIGPNIYEADRFATAAFAMQEKGIDFIQSLPGFEGYMINKNGLATYTLGFEKYVVK
jgi:thiamine biosynthesis lipoprotein